ncbi:hypothetical protein MW887_009333 [Aspergillus wentii]|nr:hypothetical protein MW887_009333 [Aspergillus wentii]
MVTKNAEAGKYESPNSLFQLGEAPEDGDISEGDTVPNTPTTPDLPMSDVVSSPEQSCQDITPDRPGSFENAHGKDAPSVTTLLRPSTDSLHLPNAETETASSPVCIRPLLLSTTELTTDPYNDGMPNCLRQSDFGEISGQDFCIRGPHGSKIVKPCGESCWEGREDNLNCSVGTLAGARSSSAASRISSLSHWILSLSPDNVVPSDECSLSKTFISGTSSDAVLDIPVQVRFSRTELPERIRYALQQLSETECKVTVDRGTKRPAEWSTVSGPIKRQCKRN